jgi:ATP-dependent DNA helicase RecG
LFQDDVSYDQLGLVVVDEQHRFGVAQRLALRDKGRIDDHAPHQLIMSATPIPRSLTMVMYADMDISVIDEMPPGRQPVETVALPNSRRLEVQDRIREACARGHRAYWVCPLVEDSEVLAVQAATSRAETLRAELPDLVIALLHGRTPSAEKEATMNDFRCGRTDVLVATTVIEVGVDVPEASVMVIENAERLGLSQLHQLRGRVGRGDRQSTCVLMYQPPLGALARERLAALRQTTDGFAIAQKDLELRGPGELLGTRQSGVPQFRVADLARDRALLPAVQTTATRLLRDNPDQAPELIARWLSHGLDFSDA